MFLGGKDLVKSLRNQVFFFWLCQFKKSCGFHKKEDEKRTLRNCSWICNRVRCSPSDCPNCDICLEHHRSWSKRRRLGNLIPLCYHPRHHLDMGKGTGNQRKVDIPTDIILRGWCGLKQYTRWDYYFLQMFYFLVIRPWLILSWSLDDAVMPLLDAQTDYFFIIYPRHFDVNIYTVEQWTWDPLLIFCDHNGCAGAWLERIAVLAAGAEIHTIGHLFRAL